MDRKVLLAVLALLLLGGIASALDCTGYAILHVGENITEHGYAIQAVRIYYYQGRELLAVDVIRSHEQGTYVATYGVFNAGQNRSYAGNYPHDGDVVTVDVCSVDYSPDAGKSSAKVKTSFEQRKTFNFSSDCPEYGLLGKSGGGGGYAGVGYELGSIAYQPDGSYGAFLKLFDIGSKTTVLFPVKPHGNYTYVASNGNRAFFDICEISNTIVAMKYSDSRMTQCKDYPVLMGFKNLTEQGYSVRLDEIFVAGDNGYRPVSLSILRNGAVVNQANVSPATIYTFVDNGKKVSVDVCASGRSISIYFWARLRINVADVNDSGILINEPATNTTDASGGVDVGKEDGTLFSVGSPLEPAWAGACAGTLLKVGENISANGYAARMDGALESVYVGGRYPPVALSIISGQEVVGKIDAYPATNYTMVYGGKGIELDICDTGTTPFPWVMMMMGVAETNGSVFLANEPAHGSTANAASGNGINENANMVDLKGETAGGSQAAPQNTSEPDESQMASGNPAGLLVFTLLMMLVGLLVYVFGLIKYRLKKAIEYTPTSKAIAVAPGLAEVAGEAMMDGELYTSPLARKECVYYETLVYRWSGFRTRSRELCRKFESGRPFYLEDETGRVLVAPQLSKEFLKAYGVMGVKAPTSGPFSNMFLPCSMKISGIPSKKGNAKMAAFLKAKLPELLNYGDIVEVEERCVEPGNRVYALGAAKEVERNGGLEMIIERGTKAVFCMAKGSEKEALASVGLETYVSVALGPLFFPGAFLFLSVMAGLPSEPGLRAGGLVVLAMYGFAAAGMVLEFFNGLVVLRNGVERARANLDALLKRRSSLIGNLNEVVAASARHEKKVISKIVEVRAAGAGSKDFAAIAESYPKLGAGKNFMALQEELARTENWIAGSRAYVADSIMLYNTKVASFPYLLFAPLMGCRQIKYKSG